jgi:hypothetical protein
MKQNLKPPNPYLSALITIGGLAAFSLLTMAATLLLTVFDLAGPAPLWISLAFFAFFGLAWLVVLLLNARKRQKIRAFLGSGRPLVRWTYSQTEWKQIKASEWGENRGDWKVQWGCLSFLLALAGMLTGIMLGVSEGAGMLIGSALVGLLLGGLAGGVLGGLVAGGNHLGVWLSYQQETPGQVALGRGEVFVIDDYFRADGHSCEIQSARLLPGRPQNLELSLKFPPRPRLPEEETWQIPVPGEYIEHVEGILDDLTQVPFR